MRGIKQLSEHRYSIDAKANVRMVSASCIALHEFPLIQTRKETRGQ